MATRPFSTFALPLQHGYLSIVDLASPSMHGPRHPVRAQPENDLAHCGTTYLHGHDTCNWTL
eukprot:11185620-Lingulodinium_polyedra.AAC.1